MFAASSAVFRMTLLAVMAGASGDSVRSLQLSSEVVRIAREQRVNRYFLDACANAAQDAAALGMLKDATAYGLLGRFQNVGAAGWNARQGHGGFVCKRGPRGKSGRSERHAGCRQAESGAPMDR